MPPCLLPPASYHLPPATCSLPPAPYYLLPTACSLLPAPYYLLLAPASLLLTTHYLRPRCSSSRCCSASASILSSPWWRRSWPRCTTYRRQLTLHPLPLPHPPHTLLTPSTHPARTRHAPSTHPPHTLTPPSTQVRVITQNIDGLHGRAGLPEEWAVEVHGRADLFKCACYPPATLGAGGLQP